jgi:uncharacterized repeat protein (TIGR01451 family)
MSKKALIFGLFVALLASSVGGAFEASNAQAAYPFGDLTCSPSAQSVMNGGYVSFSAQYLNMVTPYGGQLTWTANGGTPSYGYGATFGTQFYLSGNVNETRLVTVTDGYQTSTCSVYVYGATPTWTPIPTWTPAPTPYNYGTFSTNHSVRNVTRGGEGASVNVYANDRLQFTTTITTGNQHVVNFRIADTLPSYVHYVSGSTTVNGAWYADIITNGGLSLGTLSANSTYTIRFDATVDSVIGNTYNALTNTMTATADSVAAQTLTTVIVVNGSYYWTPTPTPTVYPYTNGRVEVSATGRNVTRGQSGELSSLRARGGDTLDMIVRVHSVSNTYTSNVYLTDILPSGVKYIAGSTTINGRVVTDGVTSSGLGLGSIAPGSETVVKFSVRVDGSYLPATGSITVSNLAQVRADGMTIVSAQTLITMGHFLSISAVSGVKTGPADSLWLALLAALLVTGCYAAYTRTDLFGRRMALSEIAALSRKSLNFAK